MILKQRKWVSGFIMSFTPIKIALLRAFNLFPVFIIIFPVPKKIKVKIVLSKKNFEKSKWMNRRRF